MDDVRLERFIQAITEQTSKTVNLLEGQDKVNTALTAQIDAIVSSFSDEKKKKSTLETKIGKLSENSSKVDVQFGKLNKTLGGVAEAIKQTNKLTAGQTKILQNLDPGSRRLKGDTYDAQTGSEQRIIKTISKIRGGMGVTRGLVTAGGAMGGYKLLGFLMKNRLLLGGLAAGGMMNPDYLKQMLGMGPGNMDIGTALGVRGYSRPTDWMLDNPGKTGLAGAGLAFGPTRRLAWRATKWGGRGIAAASTIPGQMARAGAAGLGSFAATPGYVPTGMTAGAPTARIPTPDSLSKIWKDATGKGKEKAAKGAKTAMKAVAKKGGSKLMIQRAGALIMARFLQGAAVIGATGGTGTVVTAALWAYTVYQVADMLLPTDVIAEWFTTSGAAQEMQGRADMQTGAVIAQAAGLKITDEQGQFLEPNEIRKSIVGGAGWRGTRKYYSNLSGETSRMEGGITDPAEIKRNLAREKWAKTMEDPFATTARGIDRLKWITIKKIMKISDGTQFIGRRWSEAELFNNHTSPQLINMYNQVILPRAKGQKAKEERARMNKGMAADARGRIEFEGGAPIAGSKAELSATAKRERYAASQGMTVGEVDAIDQTRKTNEQKASLYYQAVGQGRPNASRAAELQAAEKLHRDSLLEETRTTNRLLQAQGGAGQGTEDTADQSHESLNDGRRANRRIPSRRVRK
jgi:hypothetical protein